MTDTHQGIPEYDELTFHDQLCGTLDDVIEQVTQISTDVEARSDGQNEVETLRNSVWQALESLNFALAGVQTFVVRLQTEADNLDTEMSQLTEQTNNLIEERDVLIEKGHELNCRIGYNALERKLEETFTSIEKYTSEESARCFRDEAEEKLKRCRDLTRVANMRTCQLDRDIFSLMEDITSLFQTYDKDRQIYVKELDLFTDVRRTRISEWLAEPRSDEMRERGEAVLDLLGLQEKRRHLNSQVIKNALRMYSFNASLNFDREDNQKMMEELSQLQNTYNAAAGVNVVLPRTARAQTDLTDGAASSGRSEREDTKSLGDSDCSGAAPDESPIEERHGKGLHRCSRRMSLATDPITDPEIVARLEEALCWPEMEQQQQLASATAPGAAAGTLEKADENVVKDHLKAHPGQVWVDAEHAGTGEAVSESSLNFLKAPASDIHQADKAANVALRNVESHPTIPLLAKRVSNHSPRRKSSLNNRAVSSLTSVEDLVSSRSGEVMGETRTQGNGPMLKPSSLKGKEWPPKKQ